MAIAEIDLRRDLPKVREQWNEVELALGKCRYSAPCVIGAMVAPQARFLLDRVVDDDGYDTLFASALIGSGDLNAPTGQIDDIVRLQFAFDRGDRDNFVSILERLEAKYLTSGDK